MLVMLPGKEVVVYQWAYTQIYKNKENKHYPYIVLY